MPANVEQMAFRGETPWHGLGNTIEVTDSIPTIRTKAGLDWAVRTAPVMFRDLTGKEHTTSDKVMYREDTMKVFDTVGPKYVPFQNAEVLEFFREYVEEGKMYIETAGRLDEGRTIWAMAHMDGEFTLPGGDKVLPRVLISNPHQYGKGATVKFTTVRVVCANTLAMALGSNGGSLQLPHTKEFDETLRQDAKRRLGIAQEKFDAFAADADTLVKTTLTDDDVEEVLALVWPKQEKVQEAVMALYSGTGIGSNLESAAGTAWGLLNAGTEYYDWQSGRSQNNRLRNAWYGTGASKKQALYAALLGKQGEAAEIVAAAEAVA